MQLARYQGLAFGSVSRTVRTLIEKGYLRKAGSAGRGRAEVLELTGEGKALIARDPLLVVSSVLANVSPKDRKVLANALASILTELQGGDGLQFSAA
jgi:DNA-binding MarR family transcriptional regulator